MRELLVEFDSEKNPQVRNRKQQSQYFFYKAKKAYKSGNYIVAINNLSDAIYLDPRNQEAVRLLEESQTRMLLE